MTSEPDAEAETEAMSVDTGSGSAALARATAPGEAPAAATPVPAGSLWRHRAFLELWAGQTVSQLGMQLGHLAIPVLAISLLGASEFEVGLLGAADTAAFLVIGLLAGAWVDRWLKRRVMIAADLVRALALALVPVLWAAGVLQMWHVIVVAVVIGVATVFFDVAYQSYIPVLVDRSKIGEANAKLETTAQIARIGGPALGGGLLALVSAPFVLAGTAVGYLVSMLFLTAIRDAERPKPAEERQGLAREIGEGLAFVWNNRHLRLITLNTGLSNLFGTISMTLASLLVLRVLGFDPAVLGLVLSVGSVGGLLGALATPRIIARIGEGTTIPVSTLVSVVAMALVPLSAAVPPALQIPVLIAAEFLFSFAVLVYNIAQVSFRQRVCPPPLLGRMNASIRFVVWGVTPIASLVSGALAAWIGVVPTMWLGAIGSLLSAGVVVFSPFMGMRAIPE